MSATPSKPDGRVSVADAIREATELLEDLYPMHHRDNTIKTLVAVLPLIDALVEAAEEAFSAVCQPADHDRLAVAERLRTALRRVRESSHA